MQLPYNDDGIDPTFDYGDLSDLFADTDPQESSEPPDPEPDESVCPVHHQRPTTLKVLLPPDQAVYLGGFLDTGQVTGVPAVVLFDMVIAVLPLSCAVERLIGPENPCRDWELIYSPPAGFDVDWLSLHPDWAVA